MASTSLLEWYHELEKADFKNFNQLKKVYGNASLVGVSSTSVAATILLTKTANCNVINCPGGITPSKAKEIFTIGLRFCLLRTQKHCHKNCNS